MIAAFSVVPCGTVRVFQAQSSMRQSELNNGDLSKPSYLCEHFGAQPYRMLTAYLPRMKTRNSALFSVPKRDRETVQVQEHMDVDIKWCCLSSVSTAVHRVPLQVEKQACLPFL